MLISAHLDRINEEIEVPTDDFALLTTAMGIRCRDAIVLGSDSQSTSRGGKTKNLGATKIIQLNRFMGMTGSGDAYHIKIVADEIKQRFGETKFSRSEMEKNLNSVIKDLHKRHNALRSEELGYNEVRTMFHPQCLIAAAHIDNTLGLYLMRDDAWVEPVEDYKIIGSGGYIGNFIMGQQYRFFESQSKKIPDAPLNYGLLITCYVINELKNFDTQTGGAVNIAVIYRGQFYEFSELQVSQFYAEGIDIISKGMGELTKSADFEKIVRAAYPKG